MELGRCADTVTKIVHLGFSTIYIFLVLHFKMSDWCVLGLNDTCKSKMNFGTFSLQCGLKNNEKKFKLILRKLRSWKDAIFPKNLNSILWGNRAATHTEPLHFTIALFFYLQYTVSSRAELMTRTHYDYLLPRLFLSLYQINR